MYLASMMGEKRTDLVLTEPDRLFEGKSTIKVLSIVMTCNFGELQLMQLVQLVGKLICVMICERVTSTMLFPLYCFCISFVLSFSLIAGKRVVACGWREADA